MRLVSFIKEKTAKALSQDEMLAMQGELGILLDSGRVLAARALNEKLLTIDDYIELWDREEVSLLEEALIGELSWDLEKFTFDREEVRLLAPIPAFRQDILCLGLNYKAHVEESREVKGIGAGKDAKKLYPDKPIYFAKRAAVVLGPGMAIPRHSGLTDRIDYETELAVVIGREGWDVPKDQVFDYVLGYTIINDISARDLQAKRGQWYLGKSLRGFTAMGPVLVTDNLGQEALSIRTYLNGNLKQDAKTDQLIFDIPTILSEISRTFGLQKGTIIATGTPAGVLMGEENPKWLSSGDKVTCVIEGIGTLENTIASN